MTQREVVSLPGFKTEASGEVTLLREEVPPSEQALLPKTKYMVLTTLSGKEEFLPSEWAFGRIADAVKLNLSQLQLNMEQARRESRQFFRATIIFSGIASVIMLVGVTLMWAKLLAVGGVTTAASIIPQLGAVLLFNKDRELRKTIETYHNHMMESQRVLTMIDLAETMGETAAKDSVKEKIVSAVLCR